MGVLREKIKDDPPARDGALFGKSERVVPRIMYADMRTGLSRRVWYLVGGCFALMFLSRVFSGTWLRH
jgi:hypothetical protein